MSPAWRIRSTPFSTRATWGGRALASRGMWVSARRPMSTGQLHKLGLGLTPFYPEQAHAAQLVAVLRQGGTAGVDQEDAVELPDQGGVGIHKDHHLHRAPKEPSHPLMKAVPVEVKVVEAVHQPYLQPSQGQEMGFLYPGVLDPVIVPPGGQDRGYLL